MKRITRNVGLLVLLIVSFLAFAVAPVAAEDTITGSRTISDTTVAPGDIFTVTVTVDITGAVYGPVLNEDVPAGWTVTEVDNAGGTYNAADTKWLWGGSQTADKTVTYTVTVPDGTTDGSYDIAGTVLATVGGTSVSHSVSTDHVTVSGGGGPVTLTWQTEPLPSVMQGSSVTFDIGFSAMAEYYSRIEDSAGNEVWRFTAAGATADPHPRTWNTAGATPGEYTIVININGADNADTKTVTVTEAVPTNIVAIGDATLKHGATTDVPIRLLSSTGVGGATVTLTFDQSIVNTTNVVAGDFDSVFIPDYSDVGTGTLRINCMASGADLTDDLTIATVTLDAVGTSGSCALSLSAELTTAGGPTETVAVNPGTFTIDAAVLGSVTISPTSSDLSTGETQQFTATCYDTDSTTIAGCTQTWTCDSPAVGTIGSSSGLFTACGVGTAAVTVTAIYGGVTKTATADVEVSAPKETVSVDGDNFTEPSIDAGTANITVNGTFDNTVTGSINITPIADPEATVGSYEFTGNDEALMGLTVTPDAAIIAELANGNDAIRIEICYDAAELASKNIDPSTLAIWRFDESTDVWVKMVKDTAPCTDNGRDGNCVWIEVSNLSTFALAGIVTPSSDDTQRRSGGGGGGSGTYPPGWFGTPTATVTSTQSSSSSSTTPATTATTAGTAKPAATKKPTVKPAAQASGSDTTPDKPAKKGLPGFEGVFAIAGLLAITYVMMRQKR